MLGAPHCQEIWAISVLQGFLGSHEHYQIWQSFAYCAGAGENYSEAEDLACRCLGIYCRFSWPQRCRMPWSWLYQASHEGSLPQAGRSNRRLAYGKCSFVDLPDSPSPICLYWFLVSGCRYTVKAASLTNLHTLAQNILMHNSCEDYRKQHQLCTIASSCAAQDCLSAASFSQCSLIE